eukprot:5688304-Amphidinium_carterae.1
MALLFSASLFLLGSLLSSREAKYANMEGFFSLECVSRVVTLSGPSVRVSSSVCTSCQRQGIWSSGPRDSPDHAP